MGLVALALFPVGARAQGWLADRKRSEGAGLRLGDFELHPGVGSEIGYDSNVFLSEDPESSAVLRVAPHLYLSTLTGDRAEGARQRVTFRAGINGSLKHYFATTAGTDIGMGQDAKLTYRPGAIFAIDLFEEFKRSIDPFTEPVAPTPTNSMVMPLGSDVAFGRDTLGLGTRLQLSTPGDVFKAGLGYKFSLDHFESDAFRDNRSNTHTVSGDTSWEFLPKTALFWNGSIGRHHFIYNFESLAPSEQATAVSQRHDSTLVTTKMGMNGAVTSTIGFTIAGGYGAGFFEDDNDYENFIAQVEARWKPAENTSLTLGYDREYSPTFQGNFARMDRFKTQLQLMLAARVVITARGEVSLLDFGVDPGQGERDDVHLLGNLGGEYRFIDWLAVTAEGSYWQNITDFVFVSGVGAARASDPAKYKRFEAWLGLRAFL